MKKQEKQTLEEALAELIGRAKTEETVQISQLGNRSG